MNKREEKILRTTNNYSYFKDYTQKGITLIALIITIIVMLILVGVTVNVALNGGLFDIAKIASKKQTRAMLKEELTIVEATMNADVVGNQDKYKFDADQEGLIRFMKTSLEEIEKNGFEVEEKYILTQDTDGDGEIDVRGLNYEELINEGLYTVKVEGSTDINDINGLIVPSKYKGEEFDVIIEISIGTNIAIDEFKIDLGEKIDVKLVTDDVSYTVGDNVKEVIEGVPIPKGFYYVTGTKNEGVVISDNIEDENNPSGTSGNQYVWIPVGVNPRIEINIEAEQKIETIRILNLYGYDETINVNSEYFEKTIAVTNNIVYEMIVKYEDGTTIDKLILVDNCYKANADSVFIKTLVGLAVKSDVTDDNIDIVLDYLEDNYKKDNPSAEFETRLDFLKTVGLEVTEEQLNDIDNPSETSSVLKYGGFYIGRYEGSSSGVKKGKVPLYATFEETNTLVESIYTDITKYGVKSKLPSTTAWDRVGTYLLETKDKDAYQIYVSSNGWAYYGGGNAYLKETGSLGYCVANKIYDLAGNAGEWTYSTNSEGISIYSRGGEYIDTGSNFNSYNEVTDSTETKGGRPILYFYDE